MNVDNVKQKITNHTLYKSLDSFQKS